MVLYKGATMKIGVLGARVIGGTLGKKWVETGHQVMFGVRNPQNPEVQRLVQSLGDNASVSSVADAIAFGNVVLFAIPGNVMDETIAQHASLLNDKIVIDAANKMGTTPMNSIATFVAQVPSAFVFRAFNNLGWENFENPSFGDLQTDLIYCGPTGEAQTHVEQLITDVGMRPIRVGGLEQLQVVDTLTTLWFALAVQQKRGRHLAFKVLME
jgi:predicted dinucleotide-binding enzyme